MFSDLFALDEIYDAPSDAEMDSKCFEMGGILLRRSFPLLNYAFVSKQERE